MIGNKRLELGDEVGVAAELQLHVEELFPGGGSKLLETRDLGLNERFGGQFRKRRAAPEGKRLAERLHAAFSSLAQKPLEAMGIYELAIHGEDVSR
jgi:hypothetical protein